MTVGTTLPPRPLDRFVELYDELERRRPWTVSRDALRYAALSLTTSDGSPFVLADRVYTVAERFREREKWTSTLRGELRFIVAALLVRTDLDPGRFCDEVARFGDALAERRARRSRAYETLAAFALLAGGTRRGIEPQVVDRFCRLYEAMKADHWWLTSPEDFPACALLALRDEAVPAIARRVEHLWQALRERGFAANDQLQLVSHVLWFNPASDSVAVARFTALRDAFRKAGVAMWTCDHDELAALTFADRPADEIVRTVVDHRARLRERRPRPDVVASFSLACGTAFLELAVASALAPADLAAWMHLQSVIAARQAVVAASQRAAAAGASAAT